MQRFYVETLGCPKNDVDSDKLVGALLVGRKPNLPTYPVCVECKARGVSCVMVAGGVPCLGPITQAGRAEAFAERLQQVLRSGVPLKRLAVSCGLERGAGRPGAASAPWR